MCVLRYFSSSTTLAHLYNFAAICCLLKKNKSLSFKIIAGCQSGTVLLPAGRPAFKRVLYLAWAGYSICWVRQRLKFFIPPRLYSEKAETAEYLYIFWGDGARKLFCSFCCSEQAQGLHFAQWMPGYFFPDTTFATAGYQKNNEHSRFFEKIMFTRCDMKGSKESTGSCVLQELPIYSWVKKIEVRKMSTAFSGDLMIGEMYTCSSFLDRDFWRAGIRTAWWIRLTCFSHLSK